MKLKIVQAGDPVLRQQSRALTKKEISSASIQYLIELMRNTMREAPGVGLAAPQIGQSLQLAVIEDRPEYIADHSTEELALYQRAIIPFHVIINPKLMVVGNSSAVFFEGCLSLAGFSALVKRSRRVAVEYLDEHAQRQGLQASGWFARILQHEIDHLQGCLYIDRMETRSFSSFDNMGRHWKDLPIENVRAALGLG